ncbi:MAG: peptidoglycan-binding domain-containing protein [Candidatus Omnitrophica bacterium]|nr:peptidoglycan-binding domain-containing protein [Candidatus Omnitrophota bacterium]MDD5611046.1 peptidoglycan-binding domain-containing protein [Candidatus Omnitrophota bacterium]
MRLLLVLFLSASLVCLVGCKKKHDMLSESQVPLSIDMIPTSNVTNVTGPTNTTGTVGLPAIPVSEPAAVNVSVPSQPALKEVSIPQGPYKPANKDIQAALKNAGFYAGEVDGKIGPKSKKAIEEFQKANNLKADGKVGPRTWAALSAYLNPAPAPEVKR